MNSKKFIELLKAVFFYPEALDALTGACSKVSKLAANSNREFSEQEMKVAKEKILSDSFLSPFGDNVAQLFSEEEVSTLLDFYSSSVAKKFSIEAKEVTKRLMHQIQGVFDEIYAASET